MLQIFGHFCFVLALISSHLQIFQNGHVLKNLTAFRYQHHAMRNNFVWIHSHNGFTLEEYIPFFWLHKSHNGPHGCGFTCTVGTNQCDYLSLGNRKTDSFQCIDITVACHYVLQFK